MEDVLKLLLSTPDGISTIVSQYKPLVYTAINEIFKMYKDLVNNDEWFATRAKYNSKYYHALISEGFSEDQAVRILIATIGGLKDYTQNTSGASIKLNK